MTITNIAGGVDDSLALASNGTVWAWGGNEQGDLGNGTNTPSYSPVQVSMPSEVTITNIAGEYDHSLALASNGTVWAWGDNMFGELGNGTSTLSNPSVPDSNTPVQVSLPSGVTITNIAGGELDSLALGITAGSATTITVTSSANPANYGQFVTFTATLFPMAEQYNFRIMARISVIQLISIVPVKQPVLHLRFQ